MGRSHEEDMLLPASWRGLVDIDDFLSIACVVPEDSLDEVCAIARQLPSASLRTKFLQQIVDTELRYGNQATIGTALACLAYELAAGCDDGLS